MRAAITIISLVVIFFARSADAYTYFVHPNGRPVGVTIPGSPSTFRLFTLAGANTSSTQFLVSKTVNGNWVQAAAGGPSGGPLYLASSVVSSGGATFGGAPRLYVVAATKPAALWEYSPDAVGLGTWNNVTGSGGPDLQNAPALAAGIFGGRVYVALRTLNGHVWTCQIASSGSACYWEDESLRFGGGWLADPNSPISVNVPSFEGDLEIYSIVGSGGGGGSAGSLQRYRWNQDRWDNAGVPAAGTTVDFVGIQARSITSTATGVVVAAWDHMSAGDTLQLARVTSTSGWQWYNLSGSTGAPPNGISYSLGNISWATDGTNHRVWVEDLWGNSLWRCELSLGTTPTCTAWPDSYWPSDQSRNYYYGFDGLGGAIWASYSQAYLTGSIAAAEYVYGAGQVAWENHLAPVSSTITTFSTPGNVGELTSDEYFGTVVLAGQSHDSVHAVPFYRSTDDGSSWVGPSYPFSSVVNVGDTDVSFDAAGTAYATTLLSGLAGLSIVTSRFGETWSSPFIIPHLPSGFPDRPSMVADWEVAGRVYLTFAGPYFMYCASGLHCADSTGVWCGPYNDPVWSNNSPIISLGAGGTLFGASRGGESSAVCPSRTGYNFAVAVRRLFNVSSLPATACPDVASWSPPWSAPECLYFYTGSVAQTRNAGAAPGILVNVSAARDSSQHAVVSVRGYTDTTGALCQPSSAHCRSDVFAAWRGDLGVWSGTEQTAMFRVNQDPLSPSWVDHILATPMAFDYSIYNFSWMDWREDTANDVYYHLFSATQTGTLPTQTTQWPTQARWWNWTGNTWPGDIHRAANARLHGHQVGVLGSTTTETNVPATALVSPYIQ